MVIFKGFGSESAFRNHLAKWFSTSTPVRMSTALHIILNIIINTVGEKGAAWGKY